MDDRLIEQELRQGRKFSMAEALGREGGGLLKGESPVPRLVQVKQRVRQLIRNHLSDPSGALEAVLMELVTADDWVCAHHLEAPTEALNGLIEPIVEQEAQLVELVRRVDMRWGQLYNERPHFERPGHPPHPDDEYTRASVCEQLKGLLQSALASPQP